MPLREAYDLTIGEHPYPKYICMNGSEMLQWLTADVDGPHMKLPRGYCDRREDSEWLGKAYVFLQWQYNLSSEWIVNVINTGNLFGLCDRLYSKFSRIEDDVECILDVFIEFIGY